MDARLTVRDTHDDVVLHGIHQLRVPPGLYSEKGGIAVIGNPIYGYVNAITDIGLSGDGRHYKITANADAGSTQIILTGETWESTYTDDSDILSIYPFRYFFGSTRLHTFRVGQGIRLIGGGTGGLDHVATVTAVDGNTITFSPATVTGGVNNVTHDETAMLQDWFDNNPTGRVYFPDGFYNFSTYHNWITGKTYALRLPENSEATNQQIVLFGGSKWRSQLIHSGPGHLFRLDEDTVTNLVIKGLGIQHTATGNSQTLSLSDAGCGLYLASETSISGGTVPQSGATNLFVEDCLFIGWMRAIFADNLQSSVIRNNSFYFNANQIAIISNISVRGIGSQTEPNANQFDYNFVQYAPKQTGAGETHTTASTTSGDGTVTVSGASFDDTYLWRLVRIDNAQVNGTSHYALIIKINSITSIELSSNPYLTGSGKTIYIYPRSCAHIHIQNGSTVSIYGGTFQGNWSSHTGESYGVLIENCDSPQISGLWMEDLGGESGAAIKLSGVRSARITGSSFKGDIPAGYGAGLYLDNVIGLTVDGCYIGSSGSAQDIVCVNGSRGISVDNSTTTGPNVLYGSETDPTGNFWPISFGPGMRYLDTSANGGMKATENMHDSFSQRNLLTNGNFADGLDSWTQDQPAALAATNGIERYERYITVSPDTTGGDAYQLQMHQEVSLPDSLQAYIPLVLGFDWYIEDRGADALSSNPTYNELRIKLVYDNGETTTQSINPSSFYGFIDERWHRACINTRIPSGTGRTVTVQVECGKGSNAAVFRISNFKITLGQRATFDDDEVISELRGGHIRNIIKTSDQILTVGDTPTGTTGNGAGIGGSLALTLSGGNNRFLVDLSTGVGPTGASTIVTITLPQTYTNVPLALITPVNRLAANLFSSGAAFIDQASCTTSTIVIKSSNVTPLAANTRYMWIIDVKGYE